MKDMLAFLHKRHLLLLLGLAGLLRLAYVFTLEEEYYYFDAAHYDQAACQILADGTFGGSLHYYNQYNNYCLEPVYPIFLAAVYGLFGHSFLAARIVQVLLSVMQLLVLYRMAQLFRPRAALWVLLFGAVYPFFIYIAGLLYVTQLFALLLTLAFYFFLKYTQQFSLKWLGLSALALGIAIAARPDALPTTVFVAAWIFFFAQIRWPRKMGHIALTALIIVLVQAPWTIRNWQVFRVLSPGRACLAETRVFDLVDLQFRIQDSEKLTTFPGREFKVTRLDTAETPIFACYLDDTLVAKLRVIEPFFENDSCYYGLIVKGGAPLQVETPEFYSGDKSNTKIRTAAATAPEVSLADGLVRIGQTETGWRSALVFSRPDSADTFRLGYPENMRATDVSRVALLFNLNEPALAADGYMIWLHPWRQADFWRVENGRPAHPVKTVDLLLKEQPTSVARLIGGNPVRFVTKHVIPEFLKFWSPAITRIETTANVSRSMNVLSILFFTPLLLFFVPGLFVARPQWRSLLVVLIPILAISLFYAVFFAELRYRIPLDGFVIIIAAIGFDGTLARLWRPRS